MLEYDRSVSINGRSENDGIAANAGEGEREVRVNGERVVAGGEFGGQRPEIGE